MTQFDAGATNPPPPVSGMKSAMTSTLGTLPPALMSRGRRGGATTSKNGATSSRRSPERGGGRSPSPTLGAVAGHDIFSSNHEPDAVITVDLIKGNCLIKDYEFNSFEISLIPPPPPPPPEPVPVPEAANSPKPDTGAAVTEPLSTENAEVAETIVPEIPPPSTLDVKVQLAGEVPGLKPPAVARSPKPPRLFIIGRNGEATEVVRD